MDTGHRAGGWETRADAALGPRQSSPAESGRTPGAAARLTDLTGATWVRHVCRSCRKTPLWAVLGEPTPVCRECREWSHRPEPLGNRRIDRVESETWRHERTYHGERTRDDG